MNNQSGNVFVVILVTIALFAALIMTFTRTSEQGAGNMSEQQARIAAQEYISYGQSIESAVNRLRARGCSENQLDFSNAVWKDDSDTPYYQPGHNGSALPECHVFGSNAGRAVAMAVPANSIDETITQEGANSFLVLRGRVPDVGNNAREDILLHARPIREEVCVAINNILNIENPDGRPPIHSFSSTAAHYTGTFPDTVTITSTGNIFNGRPAFCSRSGNLSRFTFVILER